MKNVTSLACLCASLLGVGVQSQAQCLKLYTLNADFDEGVLFNVNHDIPNQLQLNAQLTTFPVMWIANAGEDSLSKIDTATGKELARYWTWFSPGMPGHAPHPGSEYSGAAPSRTAVDSQGNVYVANRHFDGRPPDVIKILAQGGIDRNGNSVIDTSSDANSSGTITPAEMLPLGDANSNGIIDPSEIQDERIEWVVRGPTSTAGDLGRSLAIDTEGDIWLGLFNSGEYFELSSVNGAILRGPISVSGNSPYGALVDGTGRLWGASLANNLLRLNTLNSGTPSPVVFTRTTGGDYGIALANGLVYQANYNGSPAVTVFNPATSTFSYTFAAGIEATLGVAADASGNIFIAGSSSGTVRKLNAAGTVLWSAAAQNGGEARGVITDSNGDCWVIHRTTDRISKFNGATGAPLGVFPVGDGPYTYTDATGLAQFTTTNPNGTWTVVRDSGDLGALWGKVSWNGSTPGASTITVDVRASDTVVGLGSQNFSPVGNGTSFCSANTIVGRFIQIRTTLTKNANDSPILFDLTVEQCDVGAPLASCTFVKNIPAGKVVRLSALDDCDPNPQIFIKDSASAFVAGPFSNGDLVVIRTNPTQPPLQAPLTGYAARIQLKGSPLVFGKDNLGNTGTPAACP